MDKNTFSQPEVAARMNESFVNYKIEMEKEDIGKLLAMKYGIRSFPSFIILNKKGELHTVLTGYSPPEDWLKSLEEILNKDTPELPGISHTLEVKGPSLYSNFVGNRLGHVSEVLNVDDAKSCPQGPKELCLAIAQFVENHFCILILTLPVIMLTIRIVVYILPARRVGD